MNTTKFKITESGWRNNSKTAFFRYEIETQEKNFELEETLDLPIAVAECSERESLLRALHLALAISYYKTFIPPIIEHPYAMTDIEASYWNTVYKHGLGEFLHKNNLDVEHLAKFSEQQGIKLVTTEHKTFNSSALLGIGGGKDSIVAGELLSEIGMTFTGFVMATGEQLGQTKEVASAMSTGLLVVNRKIDLQILELNKLDGAYNGHIPISLVFALVGSLLAIGRGNKYIVVGNEASASIPQASYQGSEINHQWSKSIEFERLFQDYLKTYVNPGLSYFSAIRPLTSVAVAKRFSKYNKYFEVFTSDNSLFKINQDKREHPRWSPKSSKSLSSFILLLPWLNEEEMLKIFGLNLLDQDDLSSLFKSLLGYSDEPVLDCVGTPEELKSSLKSAIDQKKFTDSSLINLATAENLLSSAEPLNNHLTLNDDAFPEELAGKIKQALQETL